MGKDFPVDVGDVVAIIKKGIDAEIKKAFDFRNPEVAKLERGLADYPIATYPAAADGILKEIARLKHSRKKIIAKAIIQIAAESDIQLALKDDAPAKVAPTGRKPRTSPAEIRRQKEAMLGILTDSFVLSTDIKAKAEKAGWAAADIAAFTDTLQSLKRDKQAVSNGERGGKGAWKKK